MAEAYIIDAVRTARGIGKPGKGALAHLHPHHLGATVLKALKERNGIKTEEVDDIIWSSSIRKGTQTGNVGRLSALDAGYDVRASSVTIDRACGGGVTAVALAAAQIRSGMEDCVIAGGTEMMSAMQTQVQEEMAAGVKQYDLDAGNAHLQEIQPQSNQGVAADAIAAMEGLSRADLEYAALISQQRAARAIEEGRFDRSIVPVVDDKGQLVLARDEYPRPDTTLEGMAELKPAFAKILDMHMGNGAETFRQAINRKYPDIDIQPIHHVGISSGVVDGAAAVLLASEAYTAKMGWKPRARILASANVGDDPTLMLNAPVPAVKKVLAKAALTVEDIDLWEINEAFAVVSEKFIRDLGLDRAKVNVNGGAMALGHPVGATGAMLIGTLLDELERTGKRLGLVTMCAAGGMAPALIIERLDS
jgi:acetyl-CoA C-acetyltransferase